MAVRLPTPHSRLPKLRPAAAVAEVAAVAALYAGLTYALAPISYGPLQLRLSEILKSLVIWEPHLILAFAIGNFLSNLGSPFAGPLELIFMPCANLVGASLCHIAGRRSPWIGAAGYAVVIAAAVSLVLSVVIKVRYAVVLPALVTSEVILIVGGVPVMAAVRRALAPVRARWRT
jgi:uncharacterized membrane protein